MPNLKKERKVIKKLQFKKTKKNFSGEEYFTYHE